METALLRFGVSLGATLLLEVPTAALLGVRTRRGILIVVLANILTNPAANLAVWVLALACPGVSRLLRELPVELCVLAVETAVYLAFSRKRGDVLPRPVLLALVCNVISWGTGFLL